MISSMKLRAKLLSGFLAVLALMALGSGLAYRQFVIVGHEVEAYAHIVHGASAAARMETRFLKLRSHARDFSGAANAANKADAEAVHALGLGLAADIEDAIAVEQNPAHLDKLKIVQKDLQLYLADFTRVEKLQQDYHRLVSDRLLPEGEKITLELQMILDEVVARGDDKARGHVEEALKHALLARLYANQVIGNKTETAGEKASREFAALAKSVKELRSDALSADGLALAEDVGLLAEDYEATLDTLLKETREIGQLVNTSMAAYETELINEAEALLALAEEEEKQLEAETLGNIETGELELLVIGVASFVAGLSLAFFLGIALSRPVKSMTRVMQDLANDNLDVEVPYTNRRDEMGEMAESVHHFQNQLREVRRLERAQEEQKLRAEAQRRVAMMKMADVFEGSVGKVVHTVTSAATQLQASAHQMAAVAAQTSQQAVAVSSATEQASTNVQTVSSAADELSASNEEIGRTVMQSNTVASDAAKKAIHTRETVANLVEEVRQIGEFTQLIREIAEQTNMLALNATIESARAGEAGKGFAVVAEEVKGLAQQTTETSARIVEQLEEVNGVTNQAADEIAAIGTAIQEADKLSGSVAAAVEEQMAATSEIARSVEEAAQGTREVAENIVKVEHASGETGSAAGQIADAASELSKQAEYLNQEVKAFLANIRAGDDQKRLVEWKDNWDTGIDVIDQHHKAFMEELNFYFGKMMSGANLDQANIALTGISDTMTEHLAIELQEMELVGYPGIDRHRQDHDAFLNTLQDILALADEGEDVSLELFDRVAAWFETHMEDEDQKFAEFVRDNGHETLLASHDTAA